MTNTLCTHMQQSNGVTFTATAGPFVCPWCEIERLQKHNDDLLRLSEQRAYRTGESEKDREIEQLRAELEIAIRSRNEYFECYTAQRAEVMRLSSEPGERPFANSNDPRHLGAFVRDEYRGSEKSSAIPCVWRSGCQDVERCTHAEKCLQISRKGDAVKSGAFLPLPSKGVELKWNGLIAEIDDYAVQCKCGWEGKVSALKSLPEFKRGCPLCNAEFNRSLWRT